MNKNRGWGGRERKGRNENENENERTLKRGSKKKKKKPNQECFPRNWKISYSLTFLEVLTSVLMWNITQHTEKGDNFHNLRTFRSLNNLTLYCYNVFSSSFEIQVLDFVMFRLTTWSPFLGKKMYFCFLITFLWSSFTRDINYKQKGKVERVQSPASNQKIWTSWSMSSYAPGLRFPCSSVLFLIRSKKEMNERPCLANDSKYRQGVDMRSRRERERERNDGREDTKKLKWMDEWRKERESNIRSRFLLESHPVSSLSLSTLIRLIPYLRDRPLLDSDSLKSRQNKE